MLILLLFSFVLIGNNLTNVAGDSATRNVVSMHQLGLIGGKPVFKPSEWGWHAIIKAYNTTTKQFVYTSVYGGSLINNQWILTAASAIKYVFVNYKVFKVDLGVNDRNETNPWSITNQAVEKIIIHPKWVDYGLDYAGYNFSSRAFYNPFYYDIALIKLKKPVKLSDKIFPVRLPSDDDENSSEKSSESDESCSESNESKGRNNKKSGFIVGFGINAPFGYNASEYLRGVNLKILSNRACVKAFENFSSDYLKVYDYNSKLQLCAGENDVRKSYCGGDIGGGLNVKKANGEWVIKGIASLPSVIYGNDVCNGGNYGTNYTGLFTRVSTFKPWILKTISDHKV